MTNQAPPTVSLKNILWPSLIAVVAIGATYWWIARAAHQDVGEPDFAKALTGYLKRAPANDKLNTKYSDANNDLVADTPSDVKDQLDPAELVFSPIAAAMVGSEADWKELLDHLGKATGKKIVFAAFEEPIMQIAEFEAGKLHIAAFSTGHVPMAVNSAGFRPLAANADEKGNYSYSMEIIVPAASTVKGPPDLKNCKLMLTSAGSHSGFKAPLVALRDDFGLKPGKDFDYVISGGHLESMKELAKSKTIHAAAVASDLLEQSVATGAPLKGGSYRTIHKAGPFPKAAIGVHYKLKPELADKLKAALLDFKFEGTKLGERLKGSGTVKFAPVDYKKDWETVRQVDAKMLKW